MSHVCALGNFGKGLRFSKIGRTYTQCTSGQGCQIFFTWSSQSLFWKEPTNWKKSSQTLFFAFHSTVLRPLCKMGRCDHGQKVPSRRPWCNTQYQQYYTVISFFSKYTKFNTAISNWTFLRQSRYKKHKERRVFQQRPNFWTMSNILKLCLTHFSKKAKIFLRGVSTPPPWSRGWVYRCFNVT